MSANTRPSQQASPIFKLDPFLLWLIFAENASMDMELSYTSRLTHRRRNTHPLAVLRASSQVCSAWRHVLLAAPSLWAQLIDIDALWWGHARWRDLVLARTGQALLSVKGCVRFDPRNEVEAETSTGVYFLSLLNEFWPRIRRLRVEVVEVGVQSAETSRKRWHVLQRPAPNLELFHIHFGLNSRSDIFTAEDYHMFSDNAPALRHFIPTNLNFPLSALCFSRLQTLKLSPYFDVPQILHAFQTMEALQSLTVNILRVPGQDSYPLPRVSLPHLTDMHVTGSTGACMPLLDHITPSAGCRVHLEARSSDLPSMQDQDTMHRVLARYAKSYLSVHAVPAVSINAQPSSFTFGTGSLASTHDIPRAPELKFKLDVMPGAVPALLSALAECDFASVRTLHIDARGLAPSDPSFARLFKKLETVETVELTPDGMEFLLLAAPRQDDCTLLPRLGTVRVAPFITTTNTDMILPFLHWRQNAGAPIETFDLELHPLAGFPMDFAFLEEMKGMRVMWQVGLESRAYVCGSGDPEVLDFKYDPLSLMYEIRKL